MTKEINDNDEFDDDEELRSDENSEVASAEQSDAEEGNEGGIVVVKEGPVTYDDTPNDADGSRVDYNEPTNTGGYMDNTVSGGWTKQDLEEFGLTDNATENIEDSGDSVFGGSEIPKDQSTLDAINGEVTGGPYQDRVEGDSDVNDVPDGDVKDETSSLPVVKEYENSPYGDWERESGKDWTPPTHDPNMTYWSKPTDTGYDKEDDYSYMKEQMPVVSPNEPPEAEKEFDAERDIKGPSRTMETLAGYGKDIKAGYNREKERYGKMASKLVAENKQQGLPYNPDFTGTIGGRRPARMGNEAVGRWKKRMAEQAKATKGGTEVLKKGTPGGALYRTMKPATVVRDEKRRDNMKKYGPRGWGGTTMGPSGKGPVSGSKGPGMIYKSTIPQGMIKRTSMSGPGSTYNSMTPPGVIRRKGLPGPGSMYGKMAPDGAIRRTGLPGPGRMYDSAAPSGALRRTGIDKPSVGVPNPGAPRMDVPYAGRPSVASGRMEGPKMDVPYAGRPTMGGSNAGGPSMGTPRMDVPYAGRPGMGSPSMGAPNMGAPSMGGGGYSNSRGSREMKGPKLFSAPRPMNIGGKITRSLGNAPAADLPLVRPKPPVTVRGLSKKAGTMPGSKKPRGEPPSLTSRNVCPPASERSMHDMFNVPSTTNMTHPCGTHGDQAQDMYRVGRYSRRPDLQRKVKRMFKM